MARVDERRAASHFHRIGTLEAAPPTPEAPKAAIPAEPMDPQRICSGEWAEAPGMVEQNRAAMQWIDRLRQRVEKNAASPARDMAPENALEKLAKRIEAGKSRARGDKSRDDPGPGSEPDV